MVHMDWTWWTWTWTRKCLVNFIYLGSLPRIISQTCLDSLVLLASPFERWATRETQKAGKGSSPLNLGIIWFLVSFQLLPSSFSSFWRGFLFIIFCPENGKKDWAYELYTAYAEASSSNQNHHEPRFLDGYFVALNLGNLKFWSGY